MSITLQAITVAPYGAVIDLPAVTVDQRIIVQQVVITFEGADPFSIDWRAELLIDDQLFVRSERGWFDGKQWNFVFTSVKVPEQCYGIRYVARSRGDMWVPIQFGEK